jgi:hypothetical protein
VENLNAVRAAIDSGNIAQARQLIREVLTNPTAEAYYLAAQVAVTDAQKREYLQKAIDLDLFHEKAHHELEALNRAVTVIPPSQTALAFDAVLATAPPPVPAKQPRSRACLWLLAIPLVLIVAVGGVIVVAALASQNGGSSPSGRSSSSSSGAGLSVNFSATSTARARANAINNTASAAAKVIGPTQTAVTARQISTAQRFLEYLFEKNYRSAGNLACRRIANAVNNGQYTSTDRAWDRLFGTEPRVSRVSCKPSRGVLQCNVEGTQNYKRFEYDLDVAVIAENNTLCVNGVNLPK